MALYTPSELRNQKGKYEKVREIDLKPGMTKNLWIPCEKTLFKRVHYNVKKFSSFKAAKYDTIDCFNQNFGENGKGCPICEEIQQLWGKWNEAKKNKDEKARLEIQGRINQLKAEYYYMNVIDLDDPEKKFYACRFSPACYREIERIDGTDGLANSVFTYAKTDTKKTSLTLNKLGASLAKELLKEEQHLMDRDYNEGGPVDLERAYIREYTKEKYMSLLNDGIEEDEHDHEEPPKKEEKKQEKVPELETVDDSIQLDDLEEKPKETQKKVEDKKEEVDIDSLDGLDLEPLNFEEDKPKKMLKISAKEINDKRKEKSFIECIHVYLLKQKKVQQTTDYVEKVKAVFAVAKQADFEIPEDELSSPF
jgi:hypothetical protein